MKSIYALFTEAEPIRYIGCSKNPADRVRLHWSSRHTKQTPVAAWLQTLPEPPKFTILETVSDEEAWSRESFYIWLLKQYDYLDLLNVSLRMGVNPSSHHPQSAETREKLRKASLEQRAGCYYTHGEQRPEAKLTEEKVREIRKAEGSLRKLGRKYGVSHNTIYHIKHNMIWKHLN